MVEIIHIKPNISKEENEENFRRVVEVLQEIANHIAQEINGA
ncbi:MAG: hypothetical protein RR782_06795 [Clostridium sp.]